MLGTKMRTETCAVSTLTAAPQSMQPNNGEVVNKKAINYSNLWPIALAPVIPAVGIALR